MHDKLREYFEQELALLETSLAGFARDYPKIAARTGITTGGHTDDLHVQRLAQSFALLASRIRVNLDDGAPKFSEALLDILHPCYRRPFPSCSIAQVRPGANTSAETVTLTRGSILTAASKAIRFRTAFDIAVSPIRISAASFSTSTVAPSRTVLPDNVASILSISLVPIASGTSLSVVAPPAIRIHLAGDASIVAALLDTLLLKTARTYVEYDGSGQWTALDDIPITSVGFEDADSLLPATAIPSFFQPLLEYVAFPQKHHFIDLALKKLLATAPARAAHRVTIHFAIAGLHPDSRETQILSGVTADHFQLACTPVVNLLSLQETVAMRGPLVAEYPLIPDSKNVRAYAIHSVDAVRIADTAVSISPYNTIEHGLRSYDPARPYWLLRHDAYAEHHAPGTEASIVLLRLDETSASVAPPILVVDVTCTNRDLPHRLRTGRPDGDLFIEHGATDSIVSLRSTPTRTFTPPPTETAHWRLIELSSPGQIQLGEGGWSEFIELLKQCLPPTNAHTRHFETASFVRARPTRAMVTLKPNSLFVVVLEITISLDETSFAGHSIAVFIELVDRYLARYVSVLNHTQLIVLSKATGAAIRRCPPRAGLIAVL